MQMDGWMDGWMTMGSVVVGDHPDGGSDSNADRDALVVNGG